MVKRIFMLAVMGAMLLPGAAMAGKADVVGVKVHAQGGGVYSFDVTVKHADSGWSHYADKWVVATSDGKILGTRVLFHPHEHEQPFTRSLGGVKIPAGITEVTIRAHDKVDGFGGKEMTVKLQP